MHRKTFSLTSFVLFLCLFAGAAAAADSAVTITPDLTGAETEVSPEFMGLSFEVSQLLPRADGAHYFSTENKPLLALFRTLGIRHLRIGGNTSDRDFRQSPADADLDSLYAFAKAAGVRVIYCLRLHGGDPQADARTANYIMDRYAPQMDSFSIGQEPSAYHDSEPYPYEKFRVDWKKFADVIAAAVPEVKLCGPSVHNNAAWTRRFLADFGHSNHITLVTAHLYPGGAGNKVPTPEIGRDQMLSDSFVKVDQRLHDGTLPACVSNGLPFRLEEANNYFHGGASNASSTFASALWGLDFAYWWAEHGASGIDFHTGDKVAVGRELKGASYNAYYTASGGYVFRPLGYGLKAFTLGGQGRLVPVTVGNPDGLNLSVYGVLGNDKHLCITIINKEYGASGRSASARLVIPGSAEAIYLTAPGNDIAASSGVTLGGAEIKNDASWEGKWTSLTSSEVQVPPASAVIVRLAAQ